MAYTFVIDPSDDKFINPKFSKTVFDTGEAKIDTKVSKMFQNVYGHFYGVVQHYSKSE